jgi:hypothetical protein
MTQKATLFHHDSDCCVVTLFHHDSDCCVMSTLECSFVLMLLVSSSSSSFRHGLAHRGGRVSSWSRVEASCAGLQSVGTCITVQHTLPLLYFLYVINETNVHTLSSILLYIDRFEKLRNQYLLKAKTVFIYLVYSNPGSCCYILYSDFLFFSTNNSAIPIERPRAQRRGSGGWPPVTPAATGKPYLQGTRFAAPTTVQ